MLYQSRDYCRYSKCLTQTFLDLPITPEKSKERLKDLCKDCEAYKFHQYLKEQGFEIIKKES